MPKLNYGLRFVTWKTKLKEPMTLEAARQDAINRLRLAYGDEKVYILEVVEVAQRSTPPVVIKEFVGAE